MDFIVNYLEAFIEKNISISRQFAEHLHLDDRVKTVKYSIISKYSKKLSLVLIPQYLLYIVSNL